MLTTGTLEDMFHGRVRVSVISCWSFMHRKSADDNSQRYPLKLLSSCYCWLLLFSFQYDLYRLEHLSFIASSLVGIFLACSVRHKVLADCEASSHQRFF